VTEQLLRVWIDPDLCTGDGICEEICPDVFAAGDDGLYHVFEKASNFPDADLSMLDQKTGKHLGNTVLARIPMRLLDDAIEAATECPGECIFIEPAA
jgi:ferredoxin